MVLLLIPEVSKTMPVHSFLSVFGKFFHYVDQIAVPFLRQDLGQFLVLLVPLIFYN